MKKRKPPTGETARRAKGGAVIAADFHYNEVKLPGRIERPNLTGKERPS